MGAAQHGNLVPRHKKLESLDAVDRLSMISQPPNRTKIR
jgi:hypothetical protein